MKYLKFPILITTILFFSCSTNENPSIEEEIIEDNEGEMEEVIELPSINTVVITEITDSDAKSGGISVDNGGGTVTQKGVCWSTEENPTLENYFTIDGDGDEDFTSSLENLEGSTTYYIRAYVTNEMGTSYGEELNFTTEETPVVVFDGNIELTSQAEVDEFGENGYTIVTGSFSIVTKDLNITDITNIDGIQQLTEVGADFYLSSTRIENINALSNLKSIGGSVTIAGNPLLENIDFLNEITEIKSDVTITLNGSAVISGFQNVTVIEGDLDIRNMDDLTTISGFNSLTTIKGLLRFRSLISISDFSGFSNVTSIEGDLDIFGSLITNLEGFSSLTNIGGDFVLNANYFLENVDGLSNLNNVGGSLDFISNSPALNNNLTDGLKNLDGLINLGSVGGDFRIRSNDLLTDFCGLKTLATNGFTGDFTISSNGYNPTQEQLLTNECSN